MSFKINDVVEVKAKDIPYGSIGVVVSVNNYGSRIQFSNYTTKWYANTELSLIPPPYFKPGDKAMIQGQEWYVEKQNTDGSYSVYIPGKTYWPSYNLTPFNLVRRDRLDISEILKGHERENFWNPYFGYVKLDYIDDSYIVLSTTTNVELFIRHDGTSIHTGEPALFPSETLDDWIAWKRSVHIPKAWDELKFCSKATSYTLECTDPKGRTSTITEGRSPIQKSVLALLKIRQLIEAGYGGNITENDWARIDVTKYTITSTLKVKRVFYLEDMCHIGFYAKEQAEEFLSHPENVQLVKDYYMIS